MPSLLGVVPQDNGELVGRDVEVQVGLMARTAGRLVSSNCGRGSKNTWYADRAAIGRPRRSPPASLTSQAMPPSAARATMLVTMRYDLERPGGRRRCTVADQDCRGRNGAVSRGTASRGQ
jgi:hypothetical protein